MRKNAMADVLKPLKTPLFDQSAAQNAAIIEACGRVFASVHAREVDDSPRRRDEVAAQSVEAFIASISGLTRTA